MKLFCTAILSLILFAGCTVIKPNAPVLAPSPMRSMPLPESKINILVTMNMDNVFKQFDSTIQRDFSGEQAVNAEFKYNWEIFRAPFKLRLNTDGSLYIKDAAHCNAVLKGKNLIGSGWFNVCTGDIDAYINLSAKFKLNNNYTLAANVRRDSFDLKECVLRSMNLNITPLVSGIVTRKIDAQIDVLNKKIDGYNVKNIFEPIWRNLFTPIQIPDIGYISINPSQVNIGAPTGAGDMMKFNAGIVARPVFSLSNPGTPTVLPLPNISTITGDGFNVYVEARLQYPELNALLKKNLTDKRIDISKHGYLKIKDVDISGVGNTRLIVKVKFQSKYNYIHYRGDLYFTCIPRYDSATQILYVTDVVFDKATEAKLQDKAVSWIIHTTIKTLLGGQVKTPLAQQVNTIKNNINAGLNTQITPNIQLVGHVNNLSIKDILPDKDYILIRMNTTGTLEAKIN